MRNFVPHVKAKSVNVKGLDPESDDIKKVLLNRRVVGVELWHVLSKGKRIVSAVSCVASMLNRPLVYHVPVGVFRFLSLFLDVQPHGVICACVVENRIQHHSYSGCMCLVYQGPKVLVGAKVRIHLPVISGVVFVVTVGLKYGIEINAGNAKFLKIRDLISYSPYISAVVVMESNLSCLPSHHAFRIYAVIPVAESLGKDLIPHRIIYPGRGSADVRRVHPGHYKI